MNKMQLFHKEQPSEFRYKCKNFISPYVIPGIIENNLPSIMPEPNHNKKITSWLNKPELINHIADYVCESFKCERWELNAKCRAQKNIDARSAYYYFLRKFAKLTYVEISKTLQLRQDHSTIIHSVKRVENAVQVKDQFGIKILHLEKTL